MEELGIYIHIPFCKQKCKYCDFISFSYNDNMIENYIKALIKEIKNRNIEDTKDKKISTIYIGGGTPSFIDSKYIIEIIKELKNKFKIENDAEITIEINPGTITENKLKDYKIAGINRVSLGLQTTHDRLLKLIGRIHSYNEFLEAYNLLKKLEFENINIDLMLALPTQTEEELTESVNQIIKLNPNHISIYSLILEENTELEKLISNGTYKLIDEEIERKMYWSVKNILEKHNYKHYEISNFAKNGQESKHNLNCWNQKEYIGFGLAAHSYYKNKRYSNIGNLDKYIENIENNKIEENIIEHEKQTSEMQKKEYMLLGLRKLDGISISEFERKFRINPLFYFRFEINRLVEKELLEVELDNIKLTSKGLDLANQVFEEFI